MPTTLILAQQSGEVPVLAIGAIGAVILFAVAIVGTWIGLKIIGRSDKQAPQKSMQTGANVLIGVGVIVLCWGAAIVSAVVAAIGYFTDLNVGTGLN